VKVQPGDAIFLRTGRWDRRQKVGPWDLIPAKPIDAAGEAGYHISTVRWMKQRDVAIIAADVSNDVRPSGVPQEVLSRVRSMPMHSLAIVTLGAYIVDAVDLEELAATAAQLNRWEFMVTGAPAAAKGATGVAPQLDGYLLRLTAGESWGGAAAALFLNSEDRPGRPGWPPHRGGRQTNRAGRLLTTNGPPASPANGPSMDTGAARN